MVTRHKILFQDARNLEQISNRSINLVITSPPYPMIKMWDDTFSKQNMKIKEALSNNDGNTAFELMHQELDKVWNEVYRVLKEGGVACINIGDATRTFNNDFKLYPNSSRIISYFLKLGFSPLPKIIWKKITNAPNKFMGSGMMPTGAYVTLEHEYILVFRKGGKRRFENIEEKNKRLESCYFWEERNVWFSDVWSDLQGVPQKLGFKETRERSAAFPFELVYRLINMYSIKDDVILDPFLGTGTTMLAAMTSKRNSIGIEVEPSFKNIIVKRIKTIKEYSNVFIQERINKHLKFIKKVENKKDTLRYINKYYDFKVKTRQEQEIFFNQLKEIKKIKKNEYEVRYLKNKNYKFFY